MPADLFDRFSSPAVAPRFTPDAAFAARPRLLKLRDALLRAAKSVGRSRWNEPPVFFFDPRRQAELEAARPAPPARFGELTALIESEMPALFATVEVRRVARAIEGLADAALAMAPHCPAARELSGLLAVPDDEVFLVLTPAARTGVRVHLRGAADVSQLRRVIAGPTPPSPFPPSLTSPPEGEVASAASRWGGKLNAGRDANPPPGGEAPPPSPSRGEGENLVPLPQLFAPVALLPDGTLPAGFAGCEHWLWPTQPLSAVPRIGGERVVLAGPATVQAPDAGPRFPALTVEAEVIQTLNQFQTAELLSQLCGHALPVQAPAETPPVARAA